jgi:predicted HTH domain antitoxin
VPRRSLEAIEVEAYRSGALAESQMRRLLGLESRFQVHALLKGHNVPLQYTAADLEDDLQAQRELGILPSL